MIFQHTNCKKLMVIHDLQAYFRLLVAIVHTTDLKNILHYLTQKFHSLADSVFGSVRFPLCRYTL